MEKIKLYIQVSDYNSIFFKRNKIYKVETEGDIIISETGDPFFFLENTYQNYKCIEINSKLAKLLYS